MATLVCLLKGESLEDAFHIKIDSNGSVGELRPLIIEQLQPPLNKLATKLLKVYSVCIRNRPALEEACCGIDRGEIMALDPFKAVKDVIDIKAEKCIHVIVKAPGKLLSGVLFAALLCTPAFPLHSSGYVLPDAN